MGRYQVRACEGTSGLDGPVIESYTQLPAAKRRAEKEAYNYYYGTVVLDTRTGLVDYGEGEGFRQPYADELD